MSSLVSTLVGILFLVVVVGFLAFTGLRLGIAFLVRRLAGLIFVLFGVTFITFILGYFAPQSAVIAQLGQHATPHAIAALRDSYGLNLPWYAQYGRYVNGLLHLDLGTSWVNSSQSVWSIIQLYLPASAVLGIAGLVLALIIGVPLGVAAAVRAGSRLDGSVQGVGLILYALPSFVIIPFYFLLMVWLHGQGLPSLAISGWGTADTMIAPILIFAAGVFAYYLRLTRSSMLETLRQDYVRTARAKGIRERTVVWRHAFRNAILPLISAVGPAVALVVVGLFIIEDFFNIPGIGNYAITSVFQGDYPVVEAIGILLALAVVFMNLVADVAYGLADPRIRTTS
ncbi:MAG TPA: ABC transporter permease [Ktedonobacterales bacterium]|nr:ABC transporter permease [Ktedonobacterales bacterium]